MTPLRWFLLLLTLAGAYVFWKDHPVYQPPGVLVADDPRQTLTGSVTLSSPPG